MASRKLHAVPAPKPEPPTRAELDAEDRARRSLAALGIDADQVADAFDQDEALLEGLAEAWRKLKRSPSIQEVADQAGVSRHIARDGLFRLRARRRVIQTRRGVYVPVIEE